MGNVQRKGNDIKEPSKISDVFTKKQVNALCGTAAMTQKILEEVLDVCVMLEDMEGYLAIWNSFPQATKCYAQRLDSEAE